MVNMVPMVWGAKVKNLNILTGDSAQKLNHA